MKKNNFLVGTRFSVSNLTDYESLPVKTGNYEVIHDGYFDGEKIWTGADSPHVKCIYFDTRYTIERELYGLDKKTLKSLLESGHLHIKSKDEENE